MATIIVIVVLGNTIDWLSDIGTRQFSGLHLISSQLLFTLSISLLFSLSHICKLFKAIRKLQVKVKYEKIIAVVMILFMLSNMEFLMTIDLFMSNTFSFSIITLRFFEIFLFLFWYNLINSFEPKDGLISNSLLDG